MNENLIAVEDSTVAGLGRLAGFFGFSEVMGRLYGMLLLSPEPLSLDDLAEGLRISKGSVSMNMRSLERWGMAKEVWVRGERKKYYMAESDMWTVIRNVLSGREMREVQLALQVLGESVQKLQEVEGDLPADEREQAVYVLERIDDLRSFFELAQMAMQTFVGSSEGMDFEGIAKIAVI
jgi:DNA-binding transcriptional regulator GbsR (MarR family)